MKEILVTGGMGYIGSHTVIELIQNGYYPVIVDNLVNSKEEVLNRLEIITGEKVEFHKVDVRDEKKLSEVFAKHNFYAVIHFAGLKAVGESVKFPDLYYDNNLGSTNTLLKVMEKYFKEKSYKIFGDFAGIAQQYLYYFSRKNSNDLF